MAELQQSLFPLETTQLIERATCIAQDNRWPLLGYGELKFGNPVEWRRDIISGETWPLDYHLDINLAKQGADVRVLWELNRLAHLVTLGRAYTITHDEKLAETFFTHLEGWRAQNPVGRGPNWACAMEVALRAMNLLAAFQLFRKSPGLDAARLMPLLSMFDAHGAHIIRNSEFSYIGTSNHYLSDVVGLFWLGTMLPELECSKRWREIGKREMLREMDVQILDDGADFESSTGYHRYVLELYLYSFILCQANQSEMAERYWRKLHAMLTFVHGYLRSDGRAPLIGDSDSGQVLPIVKRDGDDHGYILSVGASFLKDPLFKPADNGAITEELLWLLGPDGLRDYQTLPANRDTNASTAYTDAGVYIMRAGDLSLLLNASGCGVNGRGSHGHNDVLSVEISACGTGFIVDPGTYVYRTDLDERNLFRSTAYHSTVEVDAREQNVINKNLPFIIGDEAQPRVLTWETSPDRDLIVAEHLGYARFEKPITHRRSVEFDKTKRFWLIEDSLTGAGEHEFRFRFHLASDVDANLKKEPTRLVLSGKTGGRLLIVPIDTDTQPELEPRWTSRDYGAKMASVSICWTLKAHAPLHQRWAIVPVCANESEGDRLDLIKHLLSK